MPSKKVKGIWDLAVIVSALGYFVDIFDLYLFGVVRVTSLKSIGVPPEELMNVGVRLLNWQMGGVLLGGVLWGVLGDKIGRVSVLFGSIFLYSAANLANAFVHDVDTYAALRFIAGFGLAGELGVAITLVSEILPKEKRGYGTTTVASIGLMGSVFAALVATRVEWRTAYGIGGALGFLLLALRVRVHDSGLFTATKADRKVKRGSLKLLFGNAGRAARFLGIFAVGLPVWVTVGIFVTFAPEFAKELGIRGVVTAGDAIFFTYCGVALGDVASGLLSQRLKSRKKALALFIGALALLLVAFTRLQGATTHDFYFHCSLMGFATGYWAVFMTMAAELFGTNLRATVTSTLPNLVRGAVVPVTLIYQYLKPTQGLTGAALTMGLSAITVALLSLVMLQETFSRDLEFYD
jgi:MFS family permease